MLNLTKLAKISFPPHRSVLSLFLLACICPGGHNVEKTIPPVMVYLPDIFKKSRILIYGKHLAKVFDERQFKNFFDILS